MNSKRNSRDIKGLLFIVIVYSGISGVYTAASLLFRNNRTCQSAVCTIAIRFEAVFFKL
jgi:hypothetical protein